MRKPNFHQSSGGFSLVEVLVSLALLSTAVMAIAMMQTKQFQAQNSIDLQTQARLMMQSIAGEIQANPSSFLAMTSAGNPLTYVGCYNERGEQISRLAPTGPVADLQGFVAHDFGAADMSQKLVTPDYCPVNQGGFEVHVENKIVGDSASLIVHVILLDFPNRAFTPQTRYYRTQVQVEL